MLPHSRITGEQVRQFDEEGYLILRDVLDHDVIRELIAAGDRLIESDCRVNRRRKPGSSSDAFRNCIERDPAFAHLIAQPLSSRRCSNC